MATEVLPASETAPAAAPETAVDADGWVYLVDGGEVVGRADVPERFAVDSPEAADFVLEIRSRIEGDLAGIDARIRAVTAQLQALRREKVRRLAWWEWRFGPSLTAFARSCLAGKSRTARFGWGSVSFRRSAGTTQILDMAAAVEWVRLWSPAAVRVAESVTVRDVLAARDLAAAATGEDERLPFLAASGPSESVAISTGVTTGEDIR